MPYWGLFKLGCDPQGIVSEGLCIYVSTQGDTIETRELNLGDEEAGVPAQPVQIDSPPSFKPASPVGALAGGDKKMVALEGVDEHDSPAFSPRAGSTGAESQGANETSRLTGDAADSADVGE
jgi:hypothetical protein